MRSGWRGTVMATIAAVAIVGLLTMAPVATANTRMVSARGTCSGESHWRLMLVKADRGIGVGFRVIQGVGGNIWRVRIVHNRHVIFRGLRATHGERGSFAVRAWARNTRGPDLFRAQARNLATDELCRARALI